MSTAEYRSGVPFLPETICDPPWMLLGENANFQVLQAMV
jgi:hypothetical protein